MSYDTWKLDCNDAQDFVRVECANCRGEHFRAGEMIEVAGELVCSNDCLEEFQANHICKNCGNAMVRDILTVAAGIFCSTACIDDYISELRAELEEILPTLYDSSSDDGLWKFRLSRKQGLLYVEDSDGSCSDPDCKRIYLHKNHTNETLNQ